MIPSSNSVPLTLQNFIQKCFTQSKTEEDRVFIERYLDGLVTKNAQSGTIWTTDWERHPVPLLPSQVKKRPRNGNHQNMRGKKRNSYMHSEPDRKKLKRGFQGEKIVGNCTMIEKDFIRNIDTTEYIRPIEVLRKSLKNIKAKYLSGEVKYEWICNQFKSIRQDLRMQSIENDFTIRVYESHGRIALQNFDITEFNQCLSVLFPLYKKEGLTRKNMNEFIGYKIIYLSFTNSEKELQDFLKLVASEKEVILSFNFKHAMTLHSALRLNNFYKVFGYLLQQAPKMSKYIIKYFQKEHRMKYVKILIKSHINTKLEIIEIMKFLGIKKSEGEEFINYLKENEVDIEPKFVIDCKKIYKKFVSLGLF